MLQGNIHLNIKPVQRNKGQSIVARVAYQTASSIRDPRTGEWHNYRYKKSELGQTRLLLPTSATTHITDHEQFWTNLEAHYKRGNSVPARTASLALPIELSADENHELMLQYGQWLSDTYGVAVQVTSHKPHSSNPHFHLAITACTVLPDGSFGKKAIALDPISAQRELKQSIAPVEILRSQWADMVNAALEKAGILERVDHRSYLRRGIQEIPQKHEGVWRHSSQIRVLGCPKAYNKDIETVNEVLRHDRREFQKTAIPRSSFGETATGGMGYDKRGADRDQTRSASNEYDHQQPARRSKDAHGDYGRDNLGHGGRGRFVPSGKTQLENGGRCHHESEQPADRHEFAHDQTGSLDSTGGRGFSDLIMPALVAATSALELEALRLSCSILRHESRRAKAPLKLPSVGFSGIVAQRVMPVVAALETEALLLQNKNCGLWLRSCPKVAMSRASATDTAPAPMGLSDIIVPKLLAATSAFETETLRLSCNILKYEGRKAAAALKLPSVGFSDIVVQAVMPVVAALETEALHLQNKSCGLWLRSCPKVAMSRASTTDTASAPMGLSDIIVPKLLATTSAFETETQRLSYSILRQEERSVKTQLKLFSIVPASASFMGTVFYPVAALTKKLAPVAAEMSFRTENLYRQIQEEEAGRRHGTARVPERLESGAITTADNNEIWHKKLWELLVAMALQESHSLDLLTRLHNACIKVQQIFPRITAVDFACTLKRHSVRTPEEQARIIQDLAKRCPTQRLVQVAISPQASKLSAARYPKTRHEEPRVSQKTLCTLGKPLQQKTRLQEPPTDPAHARRNLWKEIKSYAEKDGRVFFDTAEGVGKLQDAIKHIWTNDPNIPFEFMHRTIFRRIVFDKDNLERFLQKTYEAIAIQKSLSTGSSIQQPATLSHASDPQPSQDFEDSEADGNNMSFT